jgi:hypothetical protein
MTEQKELIPWTDLNLQKNKIVQSISGYTNNSGKIIKNKALYKSVNSRTANKAKPEKFINKMMDITKKNKVVGLSINMYRHLPENIRKKINNKKNVNNITKEEIDIIYDILKSYANDPNKVVYLSIGSKKTYTQKPKLLRSLFDAIEREVSKTRHGC